MKKGLRPATGEKNTEKKDKRRIVWVDLDGTLAQYSGWHGIEDIGDPFPGAAEFMKELREIARVGIYSVRTNSKINKYPEEELKAHISDWLEANGIEYDEIYSGPGKPPGSAYVDDRAAECEPGENDDAYSEALDRVKELVEKDND